MIAELWNALQAGKELSNPAGWKKGLELTNYILAVIGGIVTLVRWKYPEFVLPEGMTEHVAEVIGTILVMINLYFNRATTKKSIGDAELPKSIEAE